MNKNKIKKFLTSPWATGLMLVAAIAMVGISSAGGARAALTYYSDDYNTRVAMKNIGVTLQENSGRLSWRDYSDKQDGTWDESHGTLSLGSEDPDGTVKIGKEYAEALSVKNTGDIEEYVRVVIDRYWENPDGTRNQELAPDLIRLKDLAGDGWIIDEGLSSSERVILYYTKPLDVGQTTTDFLTAVYADPSLGDLVVETKAQDGKYTHITTKFIYDGVKMGLDIEADAVQTHSPDDAVWSAWGRRVRVAGDGTLYLR